MPGPCQSAAGPLRADAIWPRIAAAAALPLPGAKRTTRALFETTTLPPEIERADVAALANVCVLSPTVSRFVGPAAEGAMRSVPPADTSADLRVWVVPAASKVPAPATETLELPATEPVTRSVPPFTVVVPV